MSTQSTYVDEQSSQPEVNEDNKFPEADNSSGGEEKQEEVSKADFNFDDIDF